MNNFNFNIGIMCNNINFIKVQDSIKRNINIRNDPSFSYEIQCYYVIIHTSPLNIYITSNESFRGIKPAHLKFDRIFVDNSVCLETKASLYTYELQSDGRIVSLENTLLRY